MFGLHIRIFMGALMWIFASGVFGVAHAEYKDRRPTFTDALEGVGWGFVVGLAVLVLWGAADVLAEGLAQ